MTPPNQRNKAIRAARDFFHKRQLIEVMTPKAVLSPALEPYMDAVWLYSQHNTKQLFLATSPEMALKKRFQSEMKVNPTAQGIYEIAPVFRDDRKSKNHNIEFTMVEWYEKDSSLNKILSEAAALIQNLGEYLTHKKIFPAYEIFTVEELFRQAGHSFTLTSEEAVVEKYQSLYATLPQHFNAMDKATICFNLLFDALILPQLRQKNVLVAVTHFPEYLGALAYCENSIAERGEIYFYGLELANGYREEWRESVARDRWLRYNQIRRERGIVEHALDRDLLACLHTMEGVCGIAVGLERVLMAIFPEWGVRDFF